MRTAQTVLTVIQERGKQHKPIERVYKLLFNRDFYLNAYAKLYPNNGAMTKGVTDETVDGMSIQKIDRMIELLREEKYQWKPARREYIPKKNGKKRPLGIPTWGDKLLQEVMREILEAYYEPQFSNHSHGFRPNRGCHTALQEIQIWKGTRWFIEGDISKYFDTIDHDVLLKILEKNIHDGRFLRLISNMLKAGYLDDWKFNQTISGTPQGGVISPLLANIYLNEFDQWIENTLIPQYTKGKRQKSNPVYNRMNAEISKARKNGDMQTAHKLEVERRNIPSVDPYDENYRRCRYVRYADDFLIGFTGSKADAEEIKAAMHNFLENELHLELSQEKTLITNASSQAAKFLGYEIKAQRANDYIDPKGRRGANGAIALFVPAKVIESKCQSFKRKGKVTHRNELLQEDDFSIVQQFQAEYRGLIQYYILAQNLSWFSTLYWVMETSLLKTLACKHRSSMKKQKKIYDLENKIAVGFPQEIQRCKELVVNLTADAATVQAHTHKDAEGKDIFSMQLMEKTYTEKEPAGKALLGLLGVALDTEKPVPIGNYKGLALQVSHAVFGNVFSVKLVGAGTYTAELGNDVLGNLTRISNLANGIEPNIEKIKAKQARLEQQLASAEEEVKRPFPQAAELAEKSNRLAVLDGLLNMNDKDIVTDTEPEQQCQAANRQRGQEER